MSGPDCPDIKLSNCQVGIRVPGGVAGEPPKIEAPYADSKVESVSMHCVSVCIGYTEIQGDILQGTLKHPICMSRSLEFPC